jgi:peptidoglycan/xylan/chitin deacetylase (PgdA/CDA1 family)
MFHRILEESRRSKYPGLRGLEVLPRVYEDLLSHFSRRGFKFLSATELGQSLANGERPKKFVVVTFDDGYRDNADFVTDFMRQKNLPWTLYLATGFCDRTLPCWWYGLADILERESKVDARPIQGGLLSLSGVSQNDKNSVYSQLRSTIHQNWAQADYRTAISEWFNTYGIDLLELTDRIAIDWDDVARMQGAGCDIGAHTTQHLNLLNCERSVASDEMAQSKKEIEARIGSPVKTFAYPFGGIDSCGEREFEMAKEVGFDLAFTTRNQWIDLSKPGSRWGLPRLNVSGTWDSLDEVTFRVNGWSVIQDGRKSISTRGGVL